MSLKGLEKRPRNICYILLLWNLACLPIIYWQNPCKLPMSFRCIKAFMHAFSGRFSRASLEGISFNFFVCFIFNVSIGSAPKRKNIDIQRNTRVGLGCQFTSNLLSCHHTFLCQSLHLLKKLGKACVCISVKTWARYTFYDKNYNISEQSFYPEAFITKSSIIILSAPSVVVR